MMVLITGRVGDSAAQPEIGRIEFSQAQRFDDGVMQVTASPVEAQVIEGRLQTIDGGPFELPANPEHTAVRVREMLGGRTFEWWARVPDEPEVEYRHLETVQSSQVPESVWGPPPWLVDAREARDQAVQARDEAQQIADAVGGLEGIEVSVQRAEDAAGASELSATAAAGSASAAASQADRAETEANRAAQAASTAGLDAAEVVRDEVKADADRAEAAADSVDMTVINQRMDEMDSSIEGKRDVENAANRVYTTSANGTQITHPLSTGPGITSVALRDPFGRLSAAAPNSDMHLTTKAYVDAELAGLAGRVPAIGEGRYRIVAGTIRNAGEAGGYWQPLIDAGHTPVGIESVETLADRIVVHFNFSGAKVIYGVANVDETLSKSSYSVGTSVGLDTLTILLSREQLVGYVSYSGGWNVAGDDFSVESYSNGILTLGHAPIAGFGATCIERDSVYRAQLGGLTAVTTQVLFKTAGGVLETAPRTDFKAWVTRQGAGSIDPRPQPPAGHNIWVYAIIEVAGA